MSAPISNAQAPILIVGGNGKTGRRVAERLQQKTVPVRLGSRQSETPFDWTLPATWAPALRGARAAYVTYFPDLAVPGSTDAIAEFTDLAVVLGVRRLVLLSGRGEAEAEECERLVQHPRVDWTIVRASWFSQNFSESYLLDPIVAGQVALPAGDVGEPFVDVEDIADVAAASLLDDRHIGQLYEVTGPRLWSFAAAVGEIARVTGREIRYCQVDSDLYADMLLAAGVPEDVTGLLLYLFREVLDGRNASVASGVEEALGRAPRDFTEYVRRTAVTDVWNPWVLR